MTTISDKDRADAQAMAETLAGQILTALTDDGVRRWLAVRERAFASHTCPSTDRRALGYYRHPRMDGQTECPECGYPMHEHGWLDCGGDGIVVCPSLHGPFGGQAVTDHARNHTCPTVPVWRPPDVAELRRLAEATTPGPRYGVDELSLLIENERAAEDIPCIAATNPTVVLGLLDDADAPRAELAHMREARDNARAEVERLSAAVRRVRELHRESNSSLSALYPDPICECGKDYPCPTVRALGAPKTPK